MNLNLPRIRWGFRRLLAGRATDFNAIASRTWMLCAEESRNARPAVFLDGALDKVTGLSPWRSWDVELLLARGGAMRHAASQAHMVENVDLVGGHLYSGTARAQMGTGPETFAQPGRREVQEVEQANLVTSWAGSHFFGPFLKSDLPLELIDEGSVANIAIRTRPYEHAQGYRELCGLHAVPLVQRARIRKLVHYTDFAQNSFKANRYRELRARLRSRVGQRPEHVSPGVYIMRGQAGERRLLTNESDLIDHLRGRGFEIVDPSGLSAAEVARRTLDVPIVISVEGSHLSHAIYTLRDAGTMLVLQPPDRFAMPFKEFTDCLDMRFAFLVGTQAEGGFSVPLDDLCRMLDRLG